jgi:hypothetical protein
MPRSLQFEHYLRTLPLDERKRIEAAESEYLARTQSRNAALERDFSDSLKGVNDVLSPGSDSDTW